MKLLITGASGFLGRYVVDTAIAHGHDVRAMVRQSSDLSRLGWVENSRVELCRHDLRARNGLNDVLRGVDCVIHLAAAKSGDIYQQLAGTVVATENLLAAMKDNGVRRFVHISSLSVYAYDLISNWSELNEDSPIEVDAFDRDEYAQTKLIQERLVRETATEQKWNFTILRPGVIWGKDNHWTARIGMKAGSKWLRFGSSQLLPLTYVENCAEAILLAAENDNANGQTLNVIDDETPSLKSYCGAIKQTVNPSVKVIPVPYFLMRALAGTISWTNRVIFKNRAKVPGIFSPSKLTARSKPLKFNNARIKQTLGWTPKYNLHDSLERSMLGVRRPDPLMAALKGQIA